MSARFVIPDRRGNNRIDSLRNLVRDPRVALLFLIPGVGETMRIIGRAKISTDPKLTESFIVNGKAPKCVLVVTVEKAYFQCTKAIIRSKLWDPASMVDRKTLPTPGSILAELTDGKMGGPEHDRLAPERDQSDDILTAFRRWEFGFARAGQPLGSGSPCHPPAALPSRSRMCSGSGATTFIGSRFL